MATHIGILPLGTFSKHSEPKATQASMSRYFAVTVYFSRWNRAKLLTPSPSKNWCVYEAWASELSFDIYIQAYLPCFYPTTQPSIEPSHLKANYWRFRQCLLQTAAHGLWVMRLWLVSIQIITFTAFLIFIDGRLLIITPIDPVFVLIPVLRAVYQVRIYWFTRNALILWPEIIGWWHTWEISNSWWHLRGSCSPASGVVSGGTRPVTPNSRHGCYTFIHPSLC